MKCSAVAVSYFIISKKLAVPYPAASNIFVQNKKYTGSAHPVSNDKALIFPKEFHSPNQMKEMIICIIIPHQKLLQSDWSVTHQHFRFLVLSAFESCHMIDIVLPRKPNICHVRDIMLPCKPNIYHSSFRKVILRRVLF